MFKKIKNIIVVLLCIGFATKLPEIHYNYIRNNISSKVVEILNPEGTGGGTGFHVVAPSGKTYILTNSHVCNGTAKDGLVMVTDSNENTLPRRVILNSDFTDLCVVEAMPGASGISIGNEPQSGQLVAVVGHPLLMPTTMTTGEIIAEEEMQILDHIMTNDVNDKCNLTKNKIEMVNSIFGPLKLCTIKINGYASNVSIFPGNSGSPVVNFYGHLVGVVFAGSNETNWGSFVTLPDVIKVLKAF